MPRPLSVQPIVYMKPLVNLSVRGAWGPPPVVRTKRAELQMNGSAWRRRQIKRLPAKQSQRNDSVRERQAQPHGPQRSGNGFPRVRLRRSSA